jgi:predicted nucleotidyltransferase
MKTGTETPKRALEKRVVWTMRDAIRLLQDIDPLLRAVGWGVGLTGSVLTKGESTDDLDLIVYPLNDGKVDRDKLRETMESWGWKLKHDVEVVHRAWRRLKSTDCKHVEVWETHVPNETGKRVDLFILR